MQPSTDPKARRRFLTQVIIYAFIVILFFLLPPLGAVTPAGMRLLGLFIAFIYGLTVSTDVWPSLATLVLLPFSSLTTFGGVITLSFGNDTYIFMMLSLVLVAYMETSGAASFVATWLLKRPALKGHPWRLMAMLLFVCWLLSSFVNAIAGMMLTWVFLYEIFSQCQYKPFEKFPSLIMLGTCVVGGLGLSTLPWGNNSVVILNAFTNMTGLQVDYFLYMGYSVPYAIVVIFLYLLMCKWLFRVDIQNLASFDPDKLSVQSQKLTPAIKLALCSMAALILLILLPSCFPADSAVVSLSKQFGLSGKLLLVFAVLQLLHIDGEPACSFVKNAKKGVDWKLMMVVPNILTFSALIGHEKAGISAFLEDVLAPLFIGKPAFIFIVLAAIATVICTNFMVNKIIAVLMISMTMPIATALGIDPIQMACLYTVICTVAFILPSASQSAFVLFSNTEWVRASYVYKYGLPVIIMMTVVHILWNLLYFSIV